jgi:AbiV family abortive infection protein
MGVTPAVLLKGAWYALEQCGKLLQDAMLLYRAKAYPSAVALAMFGREELGKHRMLLEEWRKAQATGILPSVEEIQTVCGNHVDKQRYSLLSLSFTGEGGSALDAAIRTRIKHKPQDTEYQQAETTIQSFLKALAKRSPDDRHTARMRALYVDLNDSGAGWNLPHSFAHHEAKKLLSDAANDYAGQRDRANPEILRALEQQELADNIEAWGDRPKLPPPIWPNFD